MIGPNIVLNNQMTALIRCWLVKTSPKPSTYCAIPIQLPYMTYYLEAQEAVQKGHVEMLVLVYGGVFLAVDETTGVPCGHVRQVGVLTEHVRIDMVSNDML